MTKGGGVKNGKKNDDVFYERPQRQKFDILNILSLLLNQHFSLSQNYSKFKKSSFSGCYVTRHIVTDSVIGEGKIYGVTESQTQKFGHMAW